MLLVLFGSIMPQLNEVTGLVPLEFQYTPTPTAVTEPWFPSVLFVWSDETTGPKKESRSVYATNPTVAITTTESCFFIAIRKYKIARLNKYYRLEVQQEYSRLSMRQGVVNREARI